MKKDKLRLPSEISKKCEPPGKMCKNEITSSNFKKRTMVFYAKNNYRQNFYNELRVDSQREIGVAPDRGT